MEIKKILKELEDLKFDAYDKIVNEVLDCIANNQNELYKNKTSNDLYKFVECIYLLLLEFDKKDAKHLFLHILEKYNIYFSLIGLESSLYLYKRKLEITKIESLSLRLLYDYENNDFDWIDIVGTIEKTTYNNELVPLLKIESITKTVEPKNSAVPKPSDDFIETAVIY